MYKCKECGQEYKDKPDFCDCGNDTFDCLEGKTTEKPKRNTSNITNSDICAWLIFTACIIASILILIFFPKITPQEKRTPEQKVVKEVHKDIPEISTFWIDSKPEPEVKETIIQQVEKITEKIVKPKPEPKKIEVKTVKKQQTVVKQQATKPQTTKPQTAKPVTKQTTAKPAQQTAKQTPKRTLDYEMINYRSALRMRLFSNLKLAEVQGSGKCGIEFSVDSTGKLINRGFTFQSDNETVNKAVYEMLMRTPRYTPPPESYDGRKIKMTFTLSPGSYEISFVD